MSSEKHVRVLWEVCYVLGDKYNWKMYFPKANAPNMLLTLCSSSLRHWGISRKVVGSIPNGVTGIFLWHNPSGSTITLGLNQPLTEMSTRSIFWGIKAAGALGWHFDVHVSIVLKSGSLILLEISGSVQECNVIVLSRCSLQDLQTSA